MSSKQELRAVVEQLAPRMSEMIPRGVSHQRLASVVLSEVQRNPKLASCSRTSFATALMECVRMGLEPGGAKGLVYLIPRAGEVTVQLGYKGLIELAMRSGRIARLNASVFYASEVERGLFSASNEPPSIVHKCAFDVDKSTVAGAYAVAELTGGQRVQIILTHDDLQARRAKAQGGGKSGPWRDEFAAMARKSALRALFSSGLVPMSDELADSFGVQHAEPAQPAQEVTEAPLVLDVNERTMMAIGMDAPE